MLFDTKPQRHKDTKKTEEEVGKNTAGRALEYLLADHQSLAIHPYVSIDVFSWQRRAVGGTHR